MAFLLSALPALGSGLLGALKGGAQALMKGEGLGGALSGALKEGVKSATGLDVGGLVEGAKRLIGGSEDVKQIARGDLLKRGLRGFQGGLRGLGLQRDLRKRLGDSLRSSVLPLKGYRPQMFMPAPFVRKPYHDRIQEMMEEDEMEEPLNFIDREQEMEE